MDFFVNALGDVFAWVFLVAGVLAALLTVVSFLVMLAELGTGRFPSQAIILILLAIQAGLVSMFGLTGDYVQRIYRQSSGRPFFLVRRVHEPVVAAASVVSRSPGSPR